MRRLLALALALAAGAAHAQIGLVPDDVVAPFPADALLLADASGAALPDASPRRAPGSLPWRPAPPLPEWGQEEARRAGEEAALLGWTPPAVRADSLPEGMPFYTGLLWGEHGAIRALGLAPSTRRGELMLRRSMLQWHQRIGLATLGAFTAQVVLGELIASDRAAHSDLAPVHRTLGYVTFGMYLGTASLSLGAPPARRYGGGFSNVRLHRYLAVVHFTGMMAQPWLGAHLADAPSPESYDARLTAHQWVGRVTYAAFAAAVVSIFFGF